MILPPDQAPDPQWLVDERLALAEHKLRRAIMLSKVSADNGNYAIAPDGLTIDEAEALLAAHTESSARIEQLEQVLRRLTNESAGFLSMADPFTHGNTNIAVLIERVNEARAALGASRV